MLQPSYKIMKKQKKNSERITKIKYFENKHNKERLNFPSEKI